MKTAISFIRLALIAAIGSAAIYFLFGTETDEDLTLFYIHLLVDKTFGLFLGYIAIGLCNMWRKDDKLIKALTKTNN